MSEHGSSADGDGRVVVIGIDCATDPKDIGLARATFYRVGNRLIVDSVRVKDGKEEGRTGRVDERRWQAVVETVVCWIKGAKKKSDPVLIALDSPLGWPAPMGPTLTGHFAGRPAQSSEAFLTTEAVVKAANRLFRRHTDHVVAERVKTPFDIGADKIARVAHSALWFLARLRLAVTSDIPLAWVAGYVYGVQAIEVYPAATLEAHGAMEKGYKTSEGSRKNILRKLTRMRRLPTGEDGHLLTIEEAEGSTGVRQEATRTDHALDAVVCCLAAADFLAGEVIAPMPEQQTLAGKEGWIWVWNGGEKVVGGVKR